jgi:hypothetical protein
LQAFARHSTYSALEASIFHSVHTHLAHQLIAGASVEQNSIGHTQIIISQDFKWIPEGLLTGGNYCRNPGQIGPNPGETWFISTPLLLVNRSETMPYMHRVTPKLFVQTFLQHPLMQTLQTQVQRSPIQRNN